MLQYASVGIWEFPSLAHVHYRLPLKPIVPSWRDTGKIYSNSHKCWLHTLALSGHRPVKPLSSHPRFVSTSGYKVSSEMQAFPLNMGQPYDPAGSLVDVISSSSFMDLAFSSGQQQLQCCCGTIIPHLEVMNFRFSCGISFRKENVHSMYV